MKRKVVLNSFVFALSGIAFLLLSCKARPADASRSPISEQQEMISLLSKKDISPESRYAILNKIAGTMLSEGRLGDLILQLTQQVEKNLDDKYNPYWLLMCAYAYTQMKQAKMAEYYFERVLRDYPDLMVKGQSIHFLCLEHLILISTNHENRINYFNMLIARFAESINTTEMYARLAREYEQVGDWTRALKTYNIFLEQNDASAVQIADMRDIYNYARNLIDFNNSPKNWTFKTLDELADTVKQAITRYQPRRLDACRSKVNFFSVSWQQDDSAATGQLGFSMQNFMSGNRIRFNEELIPGSSINEAYLKTSGWTSAVPTWYFYFRKVNFPADPDIHGNWEWAGIYIGERM